MKKTLFSIFGLVYAMMGFAQDGTMLFDGQKATYEIRDDRRIGPGVKYTEYYFDDIRTYSGAYKMRALVVEIDNEKENYQSPYMARYGQNQEYHQSTTQKEEYNLQMYTLKKTPIASVMAGGFIQDPNSGTLIQMEVPNGLVADGIMHYMPQSGVVHYYVDGNGNVVIGKLTCNPVIKAESAGSYNIAGYNRIRSNWPNGITVFANGYGKEGKFCTADVESAKKKGTEVVVALDDTDANICSGIYKGKVVKTYSGSFNTFEKGQFVLSALQGEAEEFLKKLSVGDAVELNFQFYNAKGEPVALKAAVRNFGGYAVEKGVAKPAKDKGYQQDALGLSADGKKSYFIHLDQNVLSNDPKRPVSNAPIAVYNQFISQINGLYEAILMDGGPSAELLVNGESQSVTYGRYIPAAMMVYSSADVSGRDKNKVSTVDFRDYSLKMFVGDTYEPKFYYFNVGGEYISPTVAKVPDVKLRCDASIGGVATNSKGVQYFYATAPGKGKIYCDYGGYTDEMMVEVAAYMGLRVEPTTYKGKVNDTFNASVFMQLADGSEQAVDNTLVRWYTNNTHTVSSCKDGVIRLNMPGRAEVTAEYMGYKAVITVDVITAIEQVELTAPVSVNNRDGRIVITAYDSSASMACALYTADGKLIDSASSNNGQVTLSRHGDVSPVLIQLVVNGKKYIYKLI